MSRHQAYRNYDYENDLDEYDGGEDGYGEEEEELSPEDKGKPRGSSHNLRRGRGAHRRTAQMEAGTAEVRSMLGAGASKVTKTQIQEALWHYYYDVDKSVAYLISKFIDPPAPKPKSAPAKNKGGRSFLASRYQSHTWHGTAWHGHGEVVRRGTSQDRELCTYIHTGPAPATTGVLTHRIYAPRQVKLTCGSTLRWHTLEAR